MKRDLIDVREISKTKFLRIYESVNSQLRKDWVEFDSSMLSRTLQTCGYMISDEAKVDYFIKGLLNYNFSEYDGDSLHVNEDFTTAKKSSIHDQMMKDLNARSFVFKAFTPSQKLVMVMYVTISKQDGYFICLVNKRLWFRSRGFKFKSGYKNLLSLAFTAVMEERVLWKTNVDLTKAFVKHIEDLGKSSTG